MTTKADLPQSASKTDLTIDTALSDDGKAVDIAPAGGTPMKKMFVCCWEPAEESAVDIDSKGLDSLEEDNDMDEEESVDSPGTMPAQEIPSSVENAMPNEMPETKDVPKAIVNKNPKTLSVAFKVAVMIYMTVAVLFLTYPVVKGTPWFIQGQDALSAKTFALSSSSLSWLDENVPEGLTSLKNGLTSIKDYTAPAKAEAPAKKKRRTFGIKK